MTKQRKKDRPEANKVGSPGDGMGNETFREERLDKVPYPGIRKRDESRRMAVSKSLEWCQKEKSLAWQVGLCCDLQG